MKTILFIINGLGMGNSTRCESIILKLLEKNYQIEVLTSANGVYYFSERSYLKRLHQFQPYFYGNSKGKISIAKTLLSIPLLLWIYFKNVLFLHQLIKKNAYAAIVTDSDYTLFWFHKSLKIPTFALNNSDIVINLGEKAKPLPQDIRMQYLVESCDYWYHRNIPRYVISPSLIPLPSPLPHINHFPAVIRDGLEIRPNRPQLQNILIMLSGSSFGFSTEFIAQLQLPKSIQIHVVGREGKNHDNIIFHGKLLNNKELINAADMMVINGGFSAVSEAIVLRKPVVIIPVPNHAEQYFNAKVVVEQGLGLAASVEEIIPRINQMVSRFEEFVLNHEKFNCSHTGAKQAADYIDKVLNNENT